jgi:hypothetical protein
MTDQAPTDLPAPEPVPDRNLPKPEPVPEDPHFSMYNPRVLNMVMNEPIPIEEGRPVGSTYDTKLSGEVPFHEVELDKAAALAIRISGRIKGTKFTQKQGGVLKRFEVESINSTVYSDEDSERNTLPMARFEWKVKQI